jgi:hypothetical protein
MNATTTIELQFEMRAKNKLFFDAKRAGKSFEECKAAENAAELYASPADGETFWEKYPSRWTTSGGMDVLAEGENVKYVRLPSGQVRYASRQ